MRQLRQAAVFTLNGFRPKPAAMSYLCDTGNESRMENELTYVAIPRRCMLSVLPVMEIPGGHPHSLPLVFPSLALFSWALCCRSSKQTSYSLTASEERKSFCQLQLAEAWRSTQAGQAWVTCPFLGCNYGHVMESLCWSSKVNMLYPLLPGCVSIRNKSFRC